MEAINGKEISRQIQEEIKLQVLALQKSGAKIPHLAAIIVGSDGASETYVNNKVKMCENVGFESTLIRLPEITSEAELLAKIDQLNKDIRIDGFIVQLPLPKHINEQKII